MLTYKTETKLTLTSTCKGIPKELKKNGFKKKLNK